jgi:hypothetical protein
MRLLSYLSALLLASGAAVNAFAGDLTKIDRTIVKEPAYKGKPKYCLLVFGPEAKTRVWLVFDGDVLYADRSGKGDLTGKGKKIVDNEPNRIYAIGDVIESGRGTKHTALAVNCLKDGRMVVTLKAEGKYPQRSGNVTFAGRPQDAPILHFNGPVSVRFTSAVFVPDPGKVRSSAADLSPKELLLKKLDKEFRLPGERRQARTVSLGAVTGTPGLGKGTFVTYRARDALGRPDERVVVEVAFPHQDAKAKPILVKSFLQPDS